MTVKWSASDSIFPVADVDGTFEVLNNDYARRRQLYRNAVRVAERERTSMPEVHPARETYDQFESLARQGARAPCPGA